ncbi:MAG TPA: CvpA family protein [Candidatus Blautia avistercoris]|mgnify:FL=1|nr:CvpA family protein [Candidatus Blautia avistercoris]
MKSKKGKIIAVLAVLIIAGIYYYVTIPAINIHATGFWIFLIALLVLCLFLYGIRKVRSPEELKTNKVIKAGLGIIVAVVAVYLIGTLLSSPIINAKKYRELITPETSDFTEDIEQISYNQIPILDKDSATLLGNRKMGSMVDMVSQFEVSSIYSQINYQGRPVRVTPLTYASPIKWLTNQKEGIPAYITIDMTTQNTELVKLKEGMKYTESEYFNRNIYRHLRFRYPTYIFDQISFEIDEEGTPFWICPVKEYTIGLFGGQTIGKVVLCNAVTGECTDMDVEDCPTWVDRVYPADLLIEMYDYHGELINGFFNSVFGQKGCLKTTEGYNYLAIDDDVWVYTGVTSVSGDKSNVGFVLMNQRTRETKYYEIPGAEEFSAMESAEGQVQNLAYTAAFPLLLNIADEPTYLIALKDNAGLVKKYAMVNIQKYQNVAIGDTVSQCEEKYLELLVDNGMLDDEKAAQSSEEKEAKGVISRMAQAVVEGNTHYYLMLENEERIYDVPITEFLGIVKYDVGDTVTLTYIEGEPACEVTSVTGASGDARAEIETESTEEETDETAAESEETQS